MFQIILVIVFILFVLLCLYVIHKEHKKERLYDKRYREHFERYAASYNPLTPDECFIIPKKEISSVVQSVLTHKERMELENELNLASQEHLLNSIDTYTEKRKESTELYELLLQYLKTDNKDAKD